jgi:hypothetical protein
MQCSCFLLVHANRYFVMMYRLQILSFGEKIDVECVSLTYISRDFTTTQMVSKLHKKVKASKSVECLSGARAPTTTCRHCCITCLPPPPKSHAGRHVEPTYPERVTRLPLKPPTPRLIEHARRTAQVPAARVHSPLIDGIQRQEASAADSGLRRRAPGGHER